MGLWRDPGPMVGRIKESNVKKGEKKSMPTNAITTTETKRSLEKKSTQPASVETRSVDSTKQFENMSKAIDHGIHSVDSTTNDLKSYMSGMFKDDPEPTIKTTDVGKVEVAVTVARQMNELMKTKLQFIEAGIELAHQLPRDVNDAEFE